MPLNVFNVVELSCKRILNIDNDDLPVGFAFVEESHDTKNLDLLDLANVADLFADFAYIERVVVAFSLSLSVGRGGIFPGLAKSI